MVYLKLQLGPHKWLKYGGLLLDFKFLENSILS